jgi:hypothetical protein
MWLLCYIYIYKMWNFEAVIIQLMFLLWCVAVCTVMLQGHTFRRIDTTCVCPLVS